MEHTNVIRQLNKFLEGNYMAIHAYDNYIKDIEDEKIKSAFQNLQKDHKQHALLIAERIQNLGGIPANDVGMKGKMAEIVQKMTGGTKELTSIIKDAIAGEQRGIKASEEILRGQLDEESLQLVKKVLNNDRKHIELLKNLLAQTNFH